MRNLICFISLLLTVISYSASADSVQRRCVTFIEKVRPGQSQTTVPDMPNKSNRVSATSGNVNIHKGENLSDSIYIAAKAAGEAWQAILCNKIPVWITISMEPLSSDVVVQNDVYYAEDESGPEAVSGPTALLLQKGIMEPGNAQAPDAHIILNSNLKWNCSFAPNTSEGYNVYTMILRQLAIAFGFGASIQQSIDGYDDAPYYTAGYYFSDFDHRVHNSQGVYLHTLDTYLPEMEEFVTSDDIFADGSEQQYALYAPSVFEPGSSLLHLKDDGYLMSHSIGEGNKFFTIDNATIDLLNTIGWGLTTTPALYKIICQDIGGDGIGSSYSAHTFTLEDGAGDISDQSWSFSLRNKDGQYVEIKNATGDSFEIPALKSTENYYVNLNGDLEGRIECTYKKDNAFHQATPFALSLELKPAIISIDDVRQVFDDPYGFKLLFNVRYTGADKISVEVEEDYNPAVRDYTFQEPFLAHAVTGYITALDYSWVTVIVQNKYGSASQTMEFEPADFSASLDQNAGILLPDSELRTVSTIEVFTVDGKPVFIGTGADFESASFTPGIYIQRLHGVDGKIITKKLIIP